jgi:hypothetical protein
MRDRLFATQPDRSVGRATVEALVILRLETHLIALATVQDHLREIGHGESAQRLLDVLREPLNRGLGRFDRGNDTGCRHVFARSVAEIAISATATIRTAFSASTVPSATATISAAIGTTTLGTRPAPVITTGTSALAAAATAETAFTAAALASATAEAAATTTASVITTSAATTPVSFALFVFEALGKSLVGG